MRSRCFGSSLPRIEKTRRRLADVQPETARTRVSGRQERGSEESVVLGDGTEGQRPSRMRDFVPGEYQQRDYRRYVQRADIKTRMNVVWSAVVKRVTPVD
jgi:hypothetical protein